jgi:hypothetical protein
MLPVGACVAWPPTALNSVFTSLTDGCVRPVWLEKRIITTRFLTAPSGGTPCGGAEPSVALAPLIFLADWARMAGAGRACFCNPAARGLERPTTMPFGFRWPVGP